MVIPWREFYYAGYIITLTPLRQANGRWRCQYSILVEALDSRPHPKQGHAEGDFDTSLEAEIAALKAAKGQIDSGV